MTKKQLSLKDVEADLKKQFEKAVDKRSILKAKQIKELYSQIALQKPEDKAKFGKQVNELKNKIVTWVEDYEDSLESAELEPIDVTAPFHYDTKKGKPTLAGPLAGSTHPIVSELVRIQDIFVKMGFDVMESRQLDDDYHMFGSLNFPEGHPARDDYDTFMTDEGLVLPAHTSTMQNRVLRSKEVPIRTVIPGRVFRNEDLDATHEHTFYQVEGVVVDQNITLGDMLGTLKSFLEAYFEQEIEYRTQPFYFPFVEPGLEFLIKTPKSLSGIKDEWMEIMGCGMIHPSVLSEAKVDPIKYSGFAWGMGVERLIMLRQGIEDVRHFESGKLDFLKQFRVNQ